MKHISISFSELHNLNIREIDRCFRKRRFFQVRSHIFKDSCTKQLALPCLDQVLTSLPCLHLPLVQPRLHCQLLPLALSHSWVDMDVLHGQGGAADVDRLLLWPDLVTAWELQEKRLSCRVFHLFCCISSTMGRNRFQLLSVCYSNKVFILFKKEQEQFNTEEYCGKRAWFESTFFFNIYFFFT